MVNRLTGIDRLTRLEKGITTEGFMSAIQLAFLSKPGLLSANEREALAEIKLGYGYGPDNLRGITCFNSWNNGSKNVPFVALCANGQESREQLAGTTLHEFAHVLAGMGEGHSKNWKEMCARLGLRNALAAGHRYTMSGFDPWFRELVATLPQLVDGKPQFLAARLGPGMTFKPRPCGIGIGRFGGKSRGVGSGSRLRKYICDCDPPVIIRAASDTLACHCDHCSGSFKQPS